MVPPFYPDESRKSEHDTRCESYAGYNYENGQWVPIGDIRPAGVRPKSPRITRPGPLVGFVPQGRLDTSCVSYITEAPPPHYLGANEPWRWVRCGDGACQHRVDTTVVACAGRPVLRILPPPPFPTAARQSPSTAVMQNGATPGQRRSRKCAGLGPGGAMHLFARRARCE